jgi:hypothetical protein
VQSLHNRLAAFCSIYRLPFYRNCPRRGVSHTRHARAILPGNAAIQVQALNKMIHGHIFFRLLPPRCVTGYTTLILALLCCENFHGGIFPQNEAAFVRFPNKMYSVFFKKHGRQSDVIRGDEIANFATNENNFDCLLGH